MSLSIHHELPESSDLWTTSTHVTAKERLKRARLTDKRVEKDGIRGCWCCHFVAGPGYVTSQAPFALNSFPRLLPELRSFCLSVA